MFFSEEKNQKTFALRLHTDSSLSRYVRDCIKSKSFLVLFFKKELLF